MAKLDALAVAKQLQTECLGLRINRLQRLVSRRYADALRPCGLTLPQVEILAVLALSGDGLAPSALAAALAVEKSTVSRNLALLVAAGWVSPDATSPSGRSMAVALTPAGAAMLTRARAAWASAQAAITKRIGPAAGSLVDGWLAALQGW